MEDDILKEEILEEEEIEEDEEEVKEYVRNGDYRENSIEWYTGMDRISVSLSEKKFVNRVLKLAEEHPDEVEIAYINENGSIFAHLPLSYLRKFAPPKTRQLSEEQKAKNIERLKKYREEKSKNN